MNLYKCPCPDLWKPWICHLVLAGINEECCVFWACTTRYAFYGLLLAFSIFHISQWRSMEKNLRVVENSFSEAQESYTIPHSDLNHSLHMLAEFLLPIYMEGLSLSSSLHRSVISCVPSVLGYACLLSDFRLSACSATSSL